MIRKLIISHKTVLRQSRLVNSTAGWCYQAPSFFPYLCFSLLNVLALFPDHHPSVIRRLQKPQTSHLDIPMSKRKKKGPLSVRPESLVQLLLSPVPSLLLCSLLPREGQTIRMKERHLSQMMLLRVGQTNLIPLQTGLISL